MDVVWKKKSRPGRIHKLSRGLRNVTNADLMRMGISRTVQQIINSVCSVVSTATTDDVAGKLRLNDAILRHKVLIDRACVTATPCIIWSTVASI